MASPVSPDRKAAADAAPWVGMAVGTSVVASASSPVSASSLSSLNDTGNPRPVASGWPEPVAVALGPCLSSSLSWLPPLPSSPGKRCAWEGCPARASKLSICCCRSLCRTASRIRAGRWEGSGPRCPRAGVSTDVAPSPCAASEASAVGGTRTTNPLLPTSTNPGRGDSLSPTSPELAVTDSRFRRSLRPSPEPEWVERLAALGLCRFAGEGAAICPSSAAKSVPAGTRLLFTLFLTLPGARPSPCPAACFGGLLFPAGCARRCEAT